MRQVWVHQRVDVPGYVKIATPNTTSVWRVEGSGITHRDANGFRVGYAMGRPPVLVLGDSFTEALSVNDDEVYTFVAQEQLERVYHVGLSLVNAGTAGRSTADYVAFAARHKNLVHPVWTVVTIRDGDLGFDAMTPGKTRFVRGGDGKLTTLVDEPRAAPGLRDLIWNNPSILVRYTFYTFHKLAEDADHQPPLFRAGSVADKPSGGVDRPDDASEPGQGDAANVEEILDSLRQAYDGRLTVVNIPYLEFDVPPPASASAPAHLLPVEITRRMFAYCARTGMSCIEPKEEFLALARQYKSPFGFLNAGFNYGHMNTEGHAALAEALARELARLRHDGLL